MGILVEFNPDLALRNIKEFKAGRRKREECIPEKLVVGKRYPFLKKGQRNYWLRGELPLLETVGNEKLSEPLASIVITEVLHFTKGDEVFTKGVYQVKEIFSKGEVRFNGFKKL